jgi:ubiquinone/menaquinone biosynthesis C-methylase UbiE
MDPKTRFSDRVESYVKYRPSYPSEVIDFIIGHFEVDRDTVIADIGSGTGIFSRLLAGHVSTIYGVEPNPKMREAAESGLNDIPSFRSVDGSAESTNLHSHSVNLITCAQAFHWFDRERAKVEFRRILKPGGKVLILWNTRMMNSDFAVRFDQLLKDYGKDYKEIDHRNITVEVLSTFFADGIVHRRTFHHVQTLDHDALIGRLRSVSYFPLPGEKNHDILVSGIEDLFDEYNENGFVHFHYMADLYWGSV